MPPIYLDHAATTPLDPRVLEAMRPYFESHHGNPSSLHRQGVAARQSIEQARQTLAQVFQTPPDAWVFTGGGTEANNLAILGVCRAYQQQFPRQPHKHLITSAIEHAAVLQPCQYLAQHGWTLTTLPVDAQGRVSPDDLQQALRPETVLVSIMHGNNEVGTLQPIQVLGQICRDAGVLFHTDAVQTAGKLPLDLGQLPIDYLTLSAHKVYGPKGVGALYMHPNALRPEPLLFGGGQESGLRSGTEAVAAIVGLAKAFSLAHEAMATETPRLHALQQQFITAIQAQVPAAQINGPLDPSERVPGNVHLSFDHTQGEALVLKLDLAGIAASSGSACHSGALTPSHVVLALGKSSALAMGTLRLSMGRSTTWEDLAVVLDRLYNCNPKA
jgi:cysteine desulfurase